MVVGSMVLVCASQAPQSQEKHAPGWTAKARAWRMIKHTRLIKRRSMKWRALRTGWVLSIIRNPAGSVSKIPRRAARARSLNFEWDISGRTVNFAIRISRLRGQPRLSRGVTLVNDRAICPNASFPDTAVQERVPESETIRTTRISLNLLGDGFVEAVVDRSLLELAREQCKQSHGKICGAALDLWNHPR